MNKWRYFGLCFLIFLVLFICIGIFHVYGNHTGKIILVNHSDQLITHATIKVCNQLIEVDNIKPKEEFIGTYKIKGDSSYDITIFFLSGKKLSSEFGYVTDGFDMEATIGITDTKIQLIDSRVLKK